MCQYHISLFNEQQWLPIFDPGIEYMIVNTGVMFVCNFKQLGELFMSIVAIATTLCLNIA